MTTTTDARGLPVGTRSTAALAAAETALWRTMSFYGTPLADLDAAHTADPAWALPLAMKAGFLLSLTEPAVLAEAQAQLDAATARLGNAAPRERDHIAALRTLGTGDWPGACRAWEAILSRHPRDVLALHWAHLFDFYRGDTAELRQRVARVLPAWNVSDPLFPYVLGLHAFGLEENRCYAEAEAAGRQALAGGAKVPWAIHAVAHVMEMQGRHAEGRAWMTRWQPDWAEGNGFRAHLGWHAALFALEALDTGGALAFYDTHVVGPAEETITLGRVDAAALLWRLHLLDVLAGDRWAALAAGWDRSAAAAGLYPFNDVHALLALVGAGDLAGAAAWFDLARQHMRPGHAGDVARAVGLPLQQAFLDFGHGRFDAAVAAFQTVRAGAVRLGGSHAQRDLVEQTLIVAALRAGDLPVARALLDERSRAKPVTPLTGHWLAAAGMR